MSVGAANVWLSQVPDGPQDTEEAFEKRHELVKLLVEKIAPSHNEDGRTKADIAYRFGPPAAPVEEE